MSNEITVIDHQTGFAETAIALPPSDDKTVVNTAHTLMKFDANVAKFGLEKAVQLAQVALAYNANPFAGPTQEVYMWEGKSFKRQDGSWGKLPPVIYFGIHYFRRVAQDDILWLVRPSVVSADKLKQFKPGFSPIPGNIYAYCLGAPLAKVNKLRSLGASYTEAKQDAAIEGLAVVAAKEMSGKRKNGSTYTIDAPKAQSWEIVAEKRAEMQFMRAASIINQPLAINTSEMQRIDVDNYPKPQIAGGDQQTLNDINDFLGYTESAGNDAPDVPSEPPFVVIEQAEPIDAGAVFEDESSVVAENNELSDQDVYVELSGEASALIDSIKRRSLLGTVVNKAAAALSRYNGKEHVIGALRTMASDHPLFSTILLDDNVDLNVKLEVHQISGLIEWLDTRKSTS